LINFLVHKQNQTSEKVYQGPSGFWGFIFLSKCFFSKIFLASEEQCCLVLRLSIHFNVQMLKAFKDHQIYLSTRMQPYLQSGRTAAHGLPLPVSGSS